MFVDNNFAQTATCLIILIAFISQSINFLTAEVQVNKARTDKLTAVR